MKKNLQAYDLSVPAKHFSFFQESRAMHILPKLLFLPSTFVLKENVCSGLPVRLDAAPLTRAAHSYVDTWFPHRLTGCEP